MYLLESVVSLLKEAQTREGTKDQDPKNGVNAALWPGDNMNSEKSQQLGRYGVWLLIGLCSPRENTPPEVGTRYGFTSSH